MLSRLNRFFEKDTPFYFTLFILAGLRVWTSKVKACPSQFDCESYLAMLQNIQFDPAIAGHHAMRVLPVLLVRAVHAFGISPTTSFQIVSGLSYCLLGLLVYWVLRREKQSTWVAFSFALICLAPHHAMRIPLQLVYQTCDMMTYLFTLGIVYASIKKRVEWVFILSLFGIVTRQNLFILGELSLLYCFFSNKQIKTIACAVFLMIAYFLLQTYYHATGVFVALLSPPAGYFTVSHLYQVLIESKIIDLFVPLIPFLFFSYQSLFHFFKKYWHLALYVMIVVGQPLLAFHMTGNNTQRLALQGVWVIYLACAFTARYSNKWITAGLVGYSLGIYFIWSMKIRWLLALGAVPFSFYPKRLQ